MNKTRISAIGMVFLILAAVWLVHTLVSALGASPPQGEYDLEPGQYISNVPGVTDTPPPTDAPEPTDMPTPIPATHDEALWHPLDEEVGHVHGVDPGDFNAELGEPGCFFGECGREIGYPMAPQEKHEFFTWMGRQNLTATNDVYVEAFRGEFHFSGGAVGVDGGEAKGGYLVRYHSFSWEAVVCRQSDGACGVVRLSGPVDTGCLQINGTQHCLAGEEDAAGDNTNLRWRAHAWFDGNDPPGTKNHVLWYGKIGDAGLPPFRRMAVDLDVDDASVQIDPNDIGTLNLVCPDNQCEFNNSLMRVHRVKFALNDRDYDDPDGDGLVSASGFMNEFGVLDESCTEPSPVCWPFSVENAPLGFYTYDPTNNAPDQPLYFEFDISPPGEFWIRHPN